MAKPIVVIPAYVPSENLPALVEGLTARQMRVIVVDDGSGASSASVFEALSRNPHVICLRHAVNLGKGAALRTGINHAIAHFPESAGVVTADADGQHLPEDILAVAAALERDPEHLVLGVRSFAAGVPFRSRLGNILTRALVRAVIGRRFQDTQTGLRGIPNSLAGELLHLTARGYEFELDMLILAKHLRTPVLEVPIATVYEHGNPTSHFQPLRDSMKIYFVLFRFAMLSALTSLLDNLVFAAMLAFTGRIAVAQVVARGAAMVLNYVTVRRAVFLSRDGHSTALPRYVLLVLCNGVASYWLLHALHQQLGTGVLASKILAELALFCVSFIVQRDLIFCRKVTESSDAFAFFKREKARIILQRAPRRAV